MRPIDIDLAAQMTADYRTNQTLKIPTNLLMSNLEEYRDMAALFIKYTGEVALESPYEWRLSICQMHMDESGNPRLIVSILPTIINSTDAKDVHDFFESKAANDKFYTDYYDVLLQKFVAATGGSFIFDDGVRWP